MKKILSLFMIFTIMVSMLTAAISVRGATYDGFSVYCTPSAFSVEEGSSETVNVSVNIANNPGIWAARIFVVYPDGLSLKGEDGAARVSPAKAVFTGEQDFTVGTPDLPLSDSTQPSAFKKLIKKQNIETEGYRSVTLYFELEDIYSTATSDGSLATLSFTLTDLAKSGDTQEIRIFYGESDFLSAKLLQNNTPVFTTYSPKIYSASVSVTPCSHPSFTKETKAPTCTENGYNKTVCTQCGYVSAETVIETTGHSYSHTVVPPTVTEQGYTVHTCTACSHSYTDSYTDPTGTTGILGDINSDGYVTSIDLNLIKRIVGGTYSVTALQMTIADVDGDGDVTAFDSNILARYVAGVISEL